MKYILAIDIGTNAFKAAIFDETGRETGYGIVEYELLTPHPGWVEMPASVYVDAFQKACREAVHAAGIRPDQILSVGMSSQGETTVFLDRYFRPLRDVIVWFDTRAGKEAEIIENSFGEKEIQRRTGQVGADAIWPGAKLLWLREHEPESFHQLGMIVQLKGYFCYLLTGHFACEDSILGSSVYFDINTREYWPEMLDFLGIREDQLPEIVRPGTDMGKILPEAASRFGLSPDTTVNIGSMDLTCGAIGAGNIRPGLFSTSMGSSLCTVSLVDHIVLDPARQMPCYCSAIPGMYMIHAYAAGGITLRWFRDSFCQEEKQRELDGGMNAYDQMDVLAEEVPAGADGLIALPHLQGSGPPDLDTGARGAFFGLTLAHGKGHFIRAIMESVSMVLRRIIDATESLGGEAQQIINYSGGSRSGIWCQIMADATGRPVTVTKNGDNACCLGAAILSGIASGLWNSIEEAVDAMVHAHRIYQPNRENKDCYDELLIRYRRLMTLTKESEEYL